MNVAYNADCMEAVRKIPDHGFNLAVVEARANESFAGGDQDARLPEYFTGRAGAARNQIISGADHFASRLQKVDMPCWNVWDEDNGGSDFADFKMAWIGFNGAARLFRFR